MTDSGGSSDTAGDSTAGRQELAAGAPEAASDADQPAKDAAPVQQVACGGAHDYSPPAAAFNFSEQQAAAARRAGC